MKQLLLVRHAESNLNYNNLKDFDRPLNNKGEKDAKIMAKQLIDLKFIPEYIISSGANRALTTSKIIAQNVNCPESDIEVNDNDKTPNSLTTKCPLMLENKSIKNETTIKI